MAWKSFGGIQYRSRGDVGEEALLRLEQVLREQAGGSYQFVQGGSEARAARGGGVADRRRRVAGLTLYTSTSAAVGRAESVSWISRGAMVQREAFLLRCLESATDVTGWVYVCALGLGKGAVVKIMGEGDTGETGHVSLEAFGDACNYRAKLQLTATGDGATVRGYFNCLLQILSDSGLYVGAGNDLQITLSSDDVYLYNATQDKDFYFQVNKGGVKTTALMIDGATGQVGIGITSPGSKLEVKGLSGETVNLVSITGETAGNLLSISATGKPTGGSWQALQGVAYVAMQANMSNIYGLNFNLRMQKTDGYTATRAHNIFVRLTLDNDFAGTLSTVYGLRASGIVDSTDSHAFTITNYYGVLVEPVTLATNIYGMASGIADAANRWNLYISGTADNYLNGDTGIKTNAPTAALDINSDILRLRTAKTPASAGAAGNAGDICWDASYIYVCTASNTWERVAIGTW